MTPKRIILVRHGLSAANDDQSVCSRIPDYKIELVDEGRMDNDWTCVLARGNTKMQHPCFASYANLLESKRHTTVRQQLQPLNPSATERFENRLDNICK